MRVEIPFRKEKVELNIPDKNILDIISGENISPGLNEDKIIIQALENPVKSRKLSEMARGRKSACIIASDITRPCPSYKFLPRLVEELNKGDIENKNIKVVLGIGIHRKHTEDEKRKLVGDYIYDSIEIIDSDVSKSKLIGHTSRGTPLEVFEGALRSDLLIATGSIEYHYFAGYSGGSKAVMPGICTRKSIQFNHSMMLDERAVAGNFFDNPVRQDIEEAGRLAGIDFIFNVILDDNKNIIAAVAGKNNEAYLEGINKYDSIYGREVEKAADIVITSQGGYPKDINLYQSQKALENVKGVVAGNGTVILVASCCEGFGDDIFEKWMADCRDYDCISRRLKREFVLGGHKAVAISRILTKIDVLLYSDFNRDETEKMGFEKIEDIQKYLGNRISQNDKIKITIVPTGRFVRLKK
ncbi:MAG: transcriptional regulator [Candidatus Hydromicrobium americanum]|nr:MAG: transcriptional regulator [Candidatus Hydromicrobium americanum]